jgi:putative transcriptional regulator
VNEDVERFTIATEEPAPGRLLVASATLLDPNFAGTVIVLLDHDEDGTLGVVLNRPSPVAVASVLPDWAPSVQPPEVLFEGGPVSNDAALAVARVPPGEGPDPIGFRRLFGPVGIIDLDTPREVLAPAVTGLRVFAGYSGWSAGQLQAEIEEGSWYVVDGLPADAFAADPDRVRRDVLRRQGWPLAAAAYAPLDPSLN